MLGAAPVLAADVTTPFAGKAVNGGTVTHETREGRHVLTVSSDFTVPGSPDPHWQVVNSRGQVFLLDRLKLKDDRINTSITLPGYVGDVTKVQMWCSWAEVVLGAKERLVRPARPHVDGSGIGFSESAFFCREPSVIGYDRVPVCDEISIRITPPEKDAKAIDLIRRILIAGGYYESITFTWISDSLVGAFRPAEDTSGGTPAPASQS